MKTFYLVLGVFVAVFAVTLFAGEVAKPAAEAEWSMNATAIEACSCPMFCQCYFNLNPAGHHVHGKGEEHFCRANIAYKINKGHSGATDLTGAKFWLTSDLGPDFSKGEMDWVVVTFDKSLSKEQRDAIGVIAGQLFPVKWKSMSTAEGNIDTWEFDENSAHATLDGGKTAEVKLVRPVGSALAEGPVVIKNLKYWGAPRNDGFVLMPNEVEAYHVGPKAFEYKGTNGFMITVDMNSNDYAKKAASK
jgi:hypothetical protein